jgi:thiol-disulfide isomerase/thioredoxin
MKSFAASRKSSARSPGNRFACLLPAAALLALAACQPAPSTTADAAATETPAGTDSAMTAEQAKLARGEFERLDFSQDLDLPASTVVDVSGAPKTLAEYRGKVVVLNLWGEWCAPCVHEMPTLANLQKAFPAEDVAVVPVAFGDADDRASAAAKLTELAGDVLPFLYDTDFNVSADAKTGAFPSTIVYGRDGKEVARLLYPADWASSDAKALIQAVIDGKV